MPNTIRILMLEDSPLDAEMAERHLKKSGLKFSIKRVTSEAGFRAELVRSQLDLILADYHLPDYNGIEALRLARELAPEIPFIFVSGSIGEERAIDALREGASDYILKDRPSRLPSAITAALARKEEQRARKRMQDALMRSEQRFHFVAEATRDVIWDWSIARHTVWVNDALLTEWGYQIPEPEVDEQVWFEAIHPDDQERVRESLRAALDSGENRWTAEYRFHHANGSWGFVYDRRVIIRNTQGEPERIIGAMHDITARKHSERRAERAEQIARIGHWSIDRKSGLGERSAELYRLFGLPVGPLDADVRDPFYERIHPNDQQKVRDAIDAPVPPREFEYRLLLPDGTMRYVQTRIEHELDADGDRLFGTTQDITDRIEAEQKIRELSRVNELILDNAAEGIVAVGLDRQLLFANPAAEEMLGWESQRQIADVHQVLHPNETEPCILKDDLSYGRTASAETDFYGTSGEVVQVRYTTSPILENGNIVGCVVTFADIRARKRLERQLDQANRVSSLGRIAATIAHEFNNVLMGIQPFAEVVKSAAPNERLQQAAANILNCVARGRRITQDILRTTKIVPPEITAIDVNHWIRELQPELLAVVGASVRLTIEVPPTSTVAAFDPAQMQQVLTNLAANARDAMPSGGVLAIRVHALATDSGESLVRISVSDTGEGIAPADLEMIFEPLFTTKRTGTGLGLAVVHQIISKNHGAIDVHSEIGKGTTFYITLPGARAEAVRETPRPAHSVRNVLLVEDDDTIAAGITALLEAEGISVRTVTRGRDALSAAEGFDPDVTVIDLGLPDIGGSEVAALLRARWPDLPIIFSTGDGDPTIAEHAADPNIRLLLKPYDFTTLLAVLREAIKGQENASSTNQPFEMDTRERPELHPSAHREKG